MDSFKTTSYVKIKKGIERHDDHSIRRIVGCNFGKTTNASQKLPKKEATQTFPWILGDLGNSSIAICCPPSLRASSWLAALLAEDPNAPTGALSLREGKGQKPFRSRWNIPGKLNEMHWALEGTKMQETIIKYNIVQ